MKRKRVLDLILVLAACVFIFSAVNLYRETEDYRDGDLSYEELQDAVTQEDDKEEQTEFTVDFEKLRSINKDVIGWIRFEAPKKISYPVVWTDDNHTYLTKTVDGSKNKVGSIFMDMNNDGSFEEKHTILYGHNMKDGSMFAGLAKYKKVNYYKKHPYFYIYTPKGEKLTYEILSVEVTKSDSDSYQMTFSSEELYAGYQDELVRRSIYPAGKQDAKAQVLTLSTCTNVTDDERLLVHGIRIKGETSNGE